MQTTQIFRKLKAKKDLCTLLFTSNNSDFQEFQIKVKLDKDC